MKYRGMLAAVAAAALCACANTPQPLTPQAPVSANDDLAIALKQAAQRAVDVRVRLAAMQAMPADAATGSASQPIPAELLNNPGARIDVDYVGPAENATKLIARILGWELTTVGKRRSDVIVSLRHSAQDPITILRDIGAQCSHRCDIHVELVEAGKSSISLTYRE